MILSVIIAALASLIISALIGFWLIPYLKRLHFGQTILEIGPKWHDKKQGTPIMGGIMFIVGSIVGITAGLTLMRLTAPDSAGLSEQQLIRIIAGVIAALCYGVIGFCDDYLKAVRHKNKGLRGWTKVFWQIIISGAYLFVLHYWGGATTIVEFPFIGSVDFGYFYFVFAMIALIGFVNAVNLSDGIDGLAASITFVASVFLIFISAALGQAGFSVTSAAVAGGCIGFLFWNFNPAKVFMGDTGSMYLGGMFVAVVFGIGKPLLVFLLGIVYLCEAVSVMIQVFYFKATHGKRLFKMTPIHHHFEMSGWSEIRIVIVFSVIAAIGGTAALLSQVL